MKQMIDIDAFSPSSLQHLRSLDEATVKRYAAAMEAGERFPAVQAVRLSDGRLALADGNHRLAAARRIGRPTIETQITEGDETLAIKLGIAGNRAHGLPMTATDRRRAAAMLLRAEPSLSDREVARQVGSSPTTVGNIRREVSILDSAPRLDLDALSRERAEIVVRYEPENPAADVAFCVTRGDRLVAIARRQGLEFVGEPSKADLDALGPIVAGACKASAAALDGLGEEIRCPAAVPVERRAGLGRELAKRYTCLREGLLRAYAGEAVE
jgi:ParB-like chromosome segregation protein Spo0J